jgi:hypothetical protein
MGFPGGLSGRMVPFGCQGDVGQLRVKLGAVPIDWEAQMTGNSLQFEAPGGSLTATFDGLTVRTGSSHEHSTVLLL